MPALLVTLAVIASIILLPTVAQGQNVDGTTDGMLQVSTAEVTPEASAESTAAADTVTAPDNGYCGYTGEATSGPFYISGAPETDNLNYKNAPGQSMTVTGVVYDGSTGKPIPNAKISIWHADSDGHYWPEAQGSADKFSKDQLNLRGIVTADENGQYQVTSIKPAIYEGRRRHIHYYIEVEGYKPIFTQSYWTDDPNVAIDGTDRDSEACRTLNFVEAPDGSTVGKFNIYLQPVSNATALASMPTAKASTDSAATSQAPSATQAAAQPFTLLNLNTSTGDQYLSTIPDFPNRMVREFLEYRPYVSIQQFRREIGKYVGDAQTAAWEKYIYVPIKVNDADAETLKQIPGVDDKIAADLIAGRSYSNNDAFLAKLAQYLTPEQVAYARNYLETLA